MGAVFFTKQVDSTFPRIRLRHLELNEQALTKLFLDQRRLAMLRMATGTRPVVDRSFEEELAGTIFARNHGTAYDFAVRTEDALAGKQVDAARMEPFLRANAAILAERFAASTADAVEDALPRGEAGVAGVFDDAIDGQVPEFAYGMMVVAANFGAHEGAQAGGGRFKTWLVHSGNPRDTHSAQNGMTIGITEVFPNGLRWPGDSGDPKEVARCFPADVKIQTNTPVEAAYKRWYRGPMVTVETRLGNVLTGTPNHPVLTNLGWVPLGQLDVVHSLANGQFGERVGPPVGAEPDIQCAPTSIGKVFDALAIAHPSQRMRGLPMDFHGDGRDADIDVVWSASGLQPRFKFIFGQPLSDFNFMLPEVIESDFIGFGYFDSLFDRYVSATSGGVGGRGQVLTLAGRQASHTQGLGIAYSTQGNAGFGQAEANRVAGDVEMLRDGLFGFTGDVAVDDFFSGQLPSAVGYRFTSSQGNAVGMQDVVERGWVNVELSTDILNRYAGSIFFDDVVDVRFGEFSGHVYNLQTSNGWYSANGIVAHNCQCSLVYS